jgi:murein DD-endopeptidase MepM/ murein hydrolase activator NlpD
MHLRLLATGLVTAVLATAARVGAATLSAGPEQAPASPTVAIDVRARAYAQGEVLRLDWRLPAAHPGPLFVRAFTSTVPAWPLDDGRWQAVVGIDLDQAPGEYDLAIVDSGGAALATHRVTVAAGAFSTRTLRVDPNFVNPPKAVMPRIERESKLLQSVFANPAPDRLWEGPMTRPVPHRANSRFGQRSIFNGEPRNAHTGTDFLSPSGTPIKAPHPGRIVVARDLYFSGGSVVIDHGQGLFSQFAHLSRIDVKEGSAVTAGDVVGLVGATGRVTGAHLHWGMRLGGARVDPLSLMAVLDDTSTP